MRTKVKALQPVAHDRVRAAAGDEFTVTKGQAEELQKAGLVELMGDASDEDDLLGSKMDAQPENKMAPAADNKTRTKGK